MTEEMGLDLKDEQGNTVKLNLEFNDYYLDITEPSDEKKFFGRYANLYLKNGALCIACYDGTDRSPVIVKITQQDIDVSNLDRSA